MNKLIYLITIVFSFSIIACSTSEEEKRKEEEERQKELEEKAKKNPLGALMKMGAEMSKAAKKQQERMEDGTLEPIHYEELYKYLPESIDGYAKGEPTGATLSAQGLSYSTAEVKYSNGDDFVKVTLMDYSAAFALYSMATSVWSMGISVDSPEEKANSLKLTEDVKGWESYKKKSKRSSAMLGVGDRFLLSIEASNQSDNSLVKEIAEDMDLEELIGL